MKEELEKEQHANGAYVFFGPHHMLHHAHGLQPAHNAFGEKGPVWIDHRSDTHNAQGKERKERKRTATDQKKRHGALWPHGGQHGHNKKGKQFSQQNAVGRQLWIDKHDNIGRRN